MQLNVVYGHQEHQLQIADDATVFDLKQIIDLMIGLPVEKQQLRFDDIILHNHTPLQCYRFGEDATILLRDLYEIFFEVEKEQFKLYVHQNNTLRELKNMLHLNHGIVIANDMTLRSNVLGIDIYINSDNIEIWAYQIFPGTVIHVDYEDS
ncbi:unnamed protein product [Dovyalis caffra]|uniref:Ubiquitin-like domain-containing protein n=1 Tax=Dovyalis caffra TaxID=77055 RepID=A0AAV1SHN4_9ROSI|nr:unnamed protein product [Dovyalis caffra]